MKEPLIHSHITDELPDSDPSAFTTIYCKSCNVMVHAFNNECMQTWIESGAGNYCLKCFAALPHEGVLEEEYGLKDHAACA
jgi:hypothetical protein